MKKMTKVCVLNDSSCKEKCRENTVVVIVEETGAVHASLLEAHK